LSIKEVETILTRRKRLFLIFSNIVVSGTVFLDLLYITRIITLPLEGFTLYNLVILGVALYSYRIKKQVNSELAKTRASHEEDEP